MKRETRSRDDLNIVLDTTSALGLQHQLRQKLIDAIHRGVLRPGRRLPSSRKLAERIGVCRNTVSLAYDALLAENHLVSRSRSGIFVASDLSSGRIAPSSRNNSPTSKLTAGLPPNVEDAGFRCPQNWHQYPYPFLDGRVTPELLPLPEWREAMRLACSRHEALSWNLGTGDGDDPMLLEEMRSKILPVRGIDAGPDELLMAMSARHGLQLVCELLVRRGVPVVLEEPFDSELQRRLRERQADVSVLDPTLSESLPGAAIVVTSMRRSLQSDSTWPRRLLAAVASADGILVEQDMLPSTRQGNQLAPALYALNSDRRVVYVGSPAPVVACGEPPGVIVADAAFIERLRQLRRTQGTAPSPISQRAWAYFIGLGHYSATLARVGRVLESRRRALRDALNHYLHEFVSIETMPGASAYWVSVPATIDCRELVHRAAANGVLLEASRLSTGREAICMGVTSLLEGQIRPGVHMLSQLVRGQLAPGSRRIEDAASAALSGRALRQAMSGATLLYNTVYGEPCTLEIRKNGELVGTAGYASEDCDRGHWWIEGDRWYRQWAQWAYGEVAGYAVVIENDQLRWYGSDGLLADTAVIIRPARPTAKSRGSLSA